MKLLPRRRLIGGFAGGLALAPWASGDLHAQPRAMLRVGQASLLKVTDGMFVNFVSGMAALGYVEGRNFVYDFITVERPADYGAAYADAVKRGADVLLATGTEPPLQAAQQAAAGRIPIVFLAIDYDPVRGGYAASLARPGGNITGIFVSAVELAVKRIELAREALPGIRRMALWWDGNSREQVEAAVAAAKTLGLDVHPIRASGQAGDYDNALRLGERLRVEAIILLSSPVYFLARAEIVRLARARNMPMIAPFREFATEGALLSYGNDLPSVLREVAAYVDRIARGAKPADLPIERPSKYELVVNLKTAKTLGLTVPPALLSRASRVIQ